MARVLKRSGPPGPGGGQQGGLVPAGRRRLGRHGPRPRDPVADQRPARTGDRATCSTTWSACCPTEAVEPRGRSTDERRGAVAGGDEDAPGPGRAGPGRTHGIPRVALVGRPNVGKSTLFNRLVGDERSVTHDAPGTTRDAVDTVVETPEGTVCFVDTAGMRRKSRTERGTEYFSVLRALDALDRSDIALLVIDATAGVTHQDQRLAERVGAAGCPTVVVLNKWELIATEDRNDILVDVGDRLAFLGDAPVLRVSALSGLGVHHILPAVAAAEEAYHSRIPTGELNRALKSIQMAHPPVGAKIQYARAGGQRPADVHAVHQRAPPAHLPPLRGAGTAGALRPRARRPSSCGCGPRAPTGVGVARR